jgi:hypothetical protein
MCRRGSGSSESVDLARAEGRLPSVAGKTRRRKLHFPQEQVFDTPIAESNVGLASHCNSMCDSSFWLEIASFA